MSVICLSMIILELKGLTSPHISSFINYYRKLQKRSIYNNNTLKQKGPCVTLPKIAERDIISESLIIVYEFSVDRLCGAQTPVTVCLKVNKNKVYLHVVRH